MRELNHKPAAKQPLPLWIRWISLPLVLIIKQVFFPVVQIDIDNLFVLANKAFLKNYITLLISF